MIGYSLGWCTGVTVPAYTTTSSSTSTGVTVWRFHMSWLVYRGRSTSLHYNLFLNIYRCHSLKIPHVLVGVPGSQYQPTLQPLPQHLPVSQLEVSTCLGWCTGVTVPAYTATSSSTSTGVTVGSFHMSWLVYRCHSTSLHYNLFLNIYRCHSLKFPHVLAGVPGSQYRPTRQPLPQHLPVSQFEVSTCIGWCTGVAVPAYTATSSSTSTGVTVWSFHMSWPVYRCHRTSLHYNLFLNIYRCHSLKFPHILAGVLVSQNQPTLQPLPQHLPVSQFEDSTCLGWCTGVTEPAYTTTSSSTSTGVTVWRFHMSWLVYWCHRTSLHYNLFLNIYRCHSLKIPHVLVGVPVSQNQPTLQPLPQHLPVSQFEVSLCWDNPCLYQVLLFW